MNISAQIIGFIALTFMCLSYQKNNKKDFLFIQILANIFYGIQYFLLKAFSALVSSIVSILKTYVFYKYEKDTKKISLFMLLLFEILIIFLGIIAYQSFYSIIPIFIACIYTYGTWQKNLKITYSIGIIASILWIFYNFIVGAYVAIFGSFIELSSSIIGIIRLNTSKKELIM